MTSAGFGADDDHSARHGEFVYCGYDFKPALPPAGPDLFWRRSWPPLHSVAPSLIAGTGRVRGPQLRRITAAISDGELRTSGPVVKVAGAICTMVQSRSPFSAVCSATGREGGRARHDLTAGCTLCCHRYGVRWRGSLGSPADPNRPKLQHQHHRDCCKPHVVCCSHGDVDAVAWACLDLMNILLDGIDLEQVWGSVGTPELASAVQSV